MERIESPRTDDSAIEREIVAKGLTAPRITPADLQANIASAHYFTANDGAQGAFARDNKDFSGIPTPEALGLLTFCVLVLQNGFTVTGESACASPENFDAEIGRKIARQNAEQKIWPLMGYALKQSLFEASNTPPAAHSDLPPHQQRVLTEKAELDERHEKLTDFFASPLFGSLPAAEQDRMRSQAIAMNAYSVILGERIAAFQPV